MRASSLKAMFILAACLAGGPAWPRGAPFPEDVVTAQVLGGAPPEEQSSTGPERPLVTQDIRYAGRASLGLPKAQDRDFRNRHKIGWDSHLFLSHWMRSDAAGAQVHVGWLYCAVHRKIWGGARVRLLAWDGKALSWSIERPMTASPIILQRPPKGGIPIGKPKGYTLQILDVALPPAPSDSSPPG